MNFWFKLIVLYSALSCPSWCLFEDQVGKFDWLIENIGHINWSKFITINSQSRLLVSSNQVLALVQPNSGKIIWRKVFEDKDGEVSSVYLSDSLNVATYHQGRQLYRLFDCSTGNVRHELSFISPEVAATSSEHYYDYVINPKHLSNVLVATQFGLKSLHVDSSLNWDYPSNVDINSKTEEVIQRKIVIDKSGDSVRLITLFSNEVHVLEIDSHSGEKTNEFKKSFEFSYKNCRVDESHIVCWEHNTINYIKLSNLNKEKEKLVSSNVGYPITNIEHIADDFYKVGLEKSSASIVQLLESEVKLLEHFEAFHTFSSVVAPYAPNSKAKYYAFMFEDVEKNLMVKVINLDTKETVFTQKMGSNKLIEKHGKVVGASVSVGKTMSNFDRVFLSMEDFNSMVIGNPKGNSKMTESVPGEKPSTIWWQKDQSLAYVVNVETCDLNLSELMITLEADFEFANRAKTTLVEMFYRRISSHFSQMVNFGKEVYEQLSTGKFLTECSADRNELERDKFNVNKMIVVLTLNGKLFGMLSKSGKIMWSHWLKDMHFGDSLDQSKSFLFIQRGTDNYKFTPRAVLVGQMRGKDTGNTVMLYFNPISGEILDKVVTSCKAKQVFTVPNLKNNEDLKTFAVLDQEYNLKVYPETAENEQLFAQYCSEHNFVAFVAESHTLSGISFKKVGKGELLWSQSIGPDHKVHSLHQKRSEELVDSPGKVQSDRTVLFKYLNPNLVFVILSPKNLEVGDSIGSEASKYQNEFNLIDIINGETVFTTSMKRVSNIHAVHSENWVVLSLWNEKNRRTELTVIELYESSRDSERNMSHFSTFSNNSAPLVLRQSYVYPHFVRSLATTYSEMGLTNKQIIVGTAIGSVFPIPKHILDPRRTMVPTQAEREEGVMPYHPVIGLPLDMTITYNRSIAFIRGSKAFPAGLESTVLLFNYGIDIFFTQIFPSDRFDVLSEDFEFWIIGSVCSGLFTASFVTKKLSAYYGLKRAWK